ncbi:hypothetical protein [Methylobacterium sp.]|uniref:hypothetical protein n=1 Tax=Methylobacterium sp. TaxID=409 RepID=UPI0025DCE0A2|nr:hypothetical protein [Methylobacterium sp.]MBY0259564.1 hypothetical protein [Methylobacterium sp.]
MTAPSLLRAARSAPDREDRIRLMAETMRKHRFGAEDGCTLQHLKAAGLSTVEIEAYSDEAYQLLSGRPAVVLVEPAGRREGNALVRAARAVRKRRALVEARQAEGRA